MRINKSGNFVVRGQITEDDGPKKINVFDGTYKSGFRIVRFSVSGEQPGGSNDVSGKVTSEEVPFGAEVWNWSDQREVAWASNAMLTTSVHDSFDSVVDSSIILVEDMYVYGHTNAGTTFEVNYLIELQPVDLQEFEYAMSFIQNKSQG